MTSEKRAFPNHKEKDISIKNEQREEKGNSERDAAKLERICSISLVI